MKLSIIVPVFNEEKTIASILDKICQVEVNRIDKKEIIVIDDGSTDSTSEKIEGFINDNPQQTIICEKHNKNKGKGSAIRTAIKLATGEYSIVQDADLEYNPEEFNKMLSPVFKANADAVYGTRFGGGEAHRILFFWHSIGNKFLTFLSNMLSNLNLTDMETCYKLVRTDILKNLNLKENHFGFEVELTAKLAKIKNIRIYEVGISYYGRTYDEGKKIKWTDGVSAIYCILKYNIFSK